MSAQNVFQFSGIRIDAGNMAAGAILTHQIRGYRVCVIYSNLLEAGISGDLACPIQEGNIPLLYWAGQITGDPRFQQIAVNHADTVASYLVREDGSCGHIACINPDTGELEHILGGQGYSETSSWSRGQSWILYGFALSYRHTKNKKYLDIAKKTSHYFISNIALTGYIPLCDFRQPASAAYTDTSAGLCAACGLLEIAEHVDECEKNLYRTYAELILKHTAETCCDWNPDTDGIVQNCKVAFHNDRREQTDLIYADYFLTEAVLRLLGKDFLIW